MLFKKRPQPVVSLYRIEKKNQNFDINSTLKQGLRLLFFPATFPSSFSSLML
jgi:hypothetical protein